MQAESLFILLIILHIAVNFFKINISQLYKKSRILIDQSFYKNVDLT